MEARLELRRIRYFVAVAEELHFGRAAERLGVSGASLTPQIQRLERELGVRLLDRSRRSVALTEAGLRFLDEARATLAQARRAELVARSAGRGEVGRIEVGYVSTAACAGVLAEAIADYRRDHPHVEIHFHKLETARQIAGVAERRLDVGFSRAPTTYPIGVTGFTVLRTSVIVGVAAGHRRACRPAIAPADLAGEGLLIPIGEEENSIRPHFRALARAGGFEPRVADRTPDVFTALVLAASGFGVAVVPEPCRAIDLPGLRFCEIADAERSFELVLAHRRNERAPACRALIDRVRTAARCSLSR